MLVIDDLQKIPTLPLPISLSIGNFDGVHRGHQKLIAQLRERAGPRGTTCILTFSNHPSTVLTGKPPAAPICSYQEKIELLEKAGVDVLISLTFSLELAKKSFDLFLKEIKEWLPFSFLILGKGAAFGRGKEGDEAHVKAIEKELGFQAEYLPKEEFEGRKISSGWIREEIAKGNLTKVNQLRGKS